MCYVGNNAITNKIAGLLFPVVDLGYEGIRSGARGY